MPQSLPSSCAASSLPYLFMSWESEGTPAFRKAAGWEKTQLANCVLGLECSLPMSPSLPCTQQTCTCWLLFVGVRLVLERFCASGFMRLHVFKGSLVVRRRVSHCIKIWDGNSWLETAMIMNLLSSGLALKSFHVGFGEKSERIYVRVTWYNSTTTPPSAGV